MKGVYISATVGIVDGRTGEFKPGQSWGLTRLDGETDWTVDSCWGPDRKGNLSVPRWCHGRGSRVSGVSSSIVNNAEMKARLDESARRGTPVPDDWTFEEPDPGQGKLF